MKTADKLGELDSRHIGHPHVRISAGLECILRPLPAALAASIPEIVRDEFGVIVHISSERHLDLLQPLTIMREEIEQAVEPVNRVLLRVKPGGTV